MKQVHITYKFAKLGLIFSVLFLCFATFDLKAQTWSLDTQSSSSDASCNKVSCGNSTCQITLNAAGVLPDKCPEGKRFDVDPNCVMNNNASEGSCMDTMPVQSIKRVSETNCYRANGAGGNPKPRNHLGTDYSAAEGTYVTAAADGTIYWARPLTGGGRTIMIEHEKKCPCTTRDCQNTYVTVYMHLSKILVSGGSVKKGTVIGLVGGSNYTSLGELCDYGHETSTCHPYGPHLHFEIHSGSRKQSYDSLKKSIINPLCDDIQSFCGGCSNKVEEECTGKTNYSEWEDLSSEASAEKLSAEPSGVATSSDLTDAMPYGNNTKCDHHRFLLDADTCLFCPLFKTLFNTASVLAQKTYKALTDGIIQVVIICFALWISWYVLQQISSLEAKKPSKMMQEILLQTFRVLLVVLILKVSYGQILKLTIDPIFNTGMNYVQVLTSAEKCPTSAPYMQGVVGYEDELTPDSKGALPITMGQNIVCSIKTMQDSVWRIVAYGRECRCVGWRMKAYIPHFLPNLSYVISGDLLIVAGLLLILAFPWCLVDCVLNMAIAAALLPAAIGAWAFKITSTYIVKMFNFFLNAMFNFVFLSIILYIIMTVVDQLLQDINNYATEFDQLLNPITGLAFWSVNGIKLLMICLIGWVFLDKGKAIANEFAEAPAMNIGETTGGTFGQVGKRIALGSKGADGKRHGGVAGLAKGGGKMLGFAASTYIGQPVRQKIGQIRNDRIMNNANAVKTTDKDGNVVYELNKHNLFGQNVTKRVTMGSSGPSFSKDHKRLLGQRTVSVTKDALVSVHEVKNAHGEVIQQDFDFHAKYTDYLIDRKGNLNTEMIQQLQSQTNLSPEQINLAIASKVLADRDIRLDSKFVERTTSYENGVLTVVQQNSDGSTSHLTTQIIGGQMLIQMDTVDKDGNITKLTDNGVMSRLVTQKQGKEATTHYAFNKHVVQNSSVEHLINFNNQYGELASSLNKDAVMLGFTQDDIMRFAEQDKSGYNQAYGKDLNAKDKAAKCQAYTQAYHFRVRAEQNLANSRNALQRAQAELETLKASITPQNKMQMQGRLNILEQRVRDAQAQCNSYSAELSRRVAHEDSTRAELRSS